ncbi:MAG: flagellar hook-associated protein FlgL [Pseudomonadota bacterium]
MRISTSSMFEAGTSQLGTLQSQMAKTQQQLATNRRMLSPADDPIASARALEVTQSQAVNTQFATNRQNVRSALSLEESALASATDVLQNVQTLTVAAGNGSLNQADRNGLADQVASQLDELLALANSTDGLGGYLFGGFRSSSPPFVRGAGGVAYEGDQGVRQMQIGSQRQIPMGDPGSAVFLSNPTGNGSFVTRADPANAGALVVSTGSVSNAAEFARDNYKLTFAVNAGVTTYTITDGQNVAVPPPPANAAMPYVSGQAINFKGMSFDVAGTPANGDVVTVGPSTKQTVFETLEKLITSLRTPATDAAGRGRLTANLAEGGTNLASALDGVLSVHSSVGSRMAELDNLDSTGEDLNIQYAATLAGLQEIDMVKTISLFTQQQFTLEAAQKSFKTLSGLSLFNYIG